MTWPLSGLRWTMMFVAIVKTDDRSCTSKITAPQQACSDGAIDSLQTQDVFAMIKAIVALPGLLTERNDNTNNCNTYNTAVNTNTLVHLFRHCHHHDPVMFIKVDEAWKEYTTTDKNSYKCLDANHVPTTNMPMKSCTTVCEKLSRTTTSTINHGLARMEELYNIFTELRIGTTR